MIKSVILPALVALSALAVSATAAYYSVTGLGELFAGATTAVIIMASTLEFSKLIVASVLYRYWDLLKSYLRIYLGIALFVLVVITSTGIYGFLSAAFQQTSNSLGVVDEQLNQVEVKKSTLKTKFDLLLTQKQQITKSIGDLQLGLSNNQVQYKDAQGNILTSTSSATRRSLEKQLDELKTREEDIDQQIDDISGSLEQVGTTELELKTKLLNAGEVGSLRYIAKITGMELDNVVNYLILLLVAVFDPLALALVTVFNVITSEKKDRYRDDESILDQKKKGESPVVHSNLPLNKFYYMKTAKTPQKQTTTTTTMPVAEELLQENLVVTQPIVEEVVKVQAQPVEEVRVEATQGKITMGDVVRIIRQSPQVTEILLKSGDTVQIYTSDFDKLRNPEDPTNNIQFL